MKTTIITTLLCILTFTKMTAQKLLDKSYSAKGMEYVALHNFSGDVSVKKYKGQEIKITVELHSGSLSEDVKVKYKQTNNAVIVYLETPCTRQEDLIEFRPDVRFLTWNEEDGCHWSSEEDDFPELIMTAWLPDGIGAYASTVTDGDVTVQDVTSEVWALNVNGNVNVIGAKAIVEGSTVNGKLSMNLP